MRKKMAVLLIFSIFVISSIAQQGASLSGSSSSVGPKNYAIINIKCGAGVTEPDGDLISDRLRAEIFNTGNANVMERNQMQDILKEQGFQQSGATCTDEDCLVKMGQMLGVHFLVAGSLGKLGSMYMVNMRTIDVQTGKIVKAVSVDVKGDIEDLVEYLPRIALQLTSDTKKQTPVVIVNTQESLTQDTAKPIVETKPSDTTHVETPNEPTDQSAKSSNGGKNKNRAGIGVMLDLYGSARMRDNNSVTDTINIYNYSGIDTNYYFYNLNAYKKEYASVKSIGVRFIIRAGQVLTIDVGPALTVGSVGYSSEAQYYSTLYTSYYNFTSKLAFNYTVPSVRLGLNFVKRWFPLKMNLGLFANIAMPITTFTAEDSYSFLTSSYADFSNSDDGYDIDFSIGFGTKTGVEIMAGPHVGFSVDFMSNWIQWDTQFIFGDFGSVTQYDATTYTIVLPRFGLGLGVNFYF